MKNNILVCLFVCLLINMRIEIHIITFQCLFTDFRSKCDARLKSADMIN